MVREFTELQGTMGGIYAREEGLPEEVWKAIYFHYLPVGVEANAAPTAGQLGSARLTWAAVSLADKVDTLVGLFAAGERPTGSRDPYGLRRAAQGIVKILVDLPALAAVSKPVALSGIVAQAFQHYQGTLKSEADGWRDALFDFVAERAAHVFERRSFRYDEIRAVLPRRKDALVPHAMARRLEALAEARKSAEFEALAVLFKRVKNITRDLPVADRSKNGLSGLKGALKEPSELALLAEMEQRWPAIEGALRREHYLEALNQLAHLRGPVDRFFLDVLVMTDDVGLREARLALLTSLRDTILDIADIAEIAPEASGG
jgi:glycyl-tRNA synthetase beta chain